MRLFAAALASLSVLAGCAVGSVDTGTFGTEGIKSSPATFAEILAGAPATNLPSVCVITTDAGSCTGTLVAPSVVLTAGHCAAARSSWRVVCPYSGDTQARTATETAVAPTYPGGGANIDARLGSDLALLRIDRPFAQGAVAAMQLDPVGSRPAALAVGRLSSDGTDRVLVSRQFSINYLEPTRGYSFGVDRVIVQPGDAGGALLDPATRAVYAVASSSVAVTACRSRQPCTQWAALAPSAQWIRSRLENWGQTPAPVDPGGGDVGEEPGAASDGGASDAGVPAADGGDIGDPGDTGEPPAGEDAGAPPSTPPASDPCAAARDCAACTAIAVCGFCNGRCTLGLPFGPLDSAVCAGQTWQWSATDCR